MLLLAGGCLLTQEWNTGGTEQVASSPQSDPSPNVRLGAWNVSAA